MPTVVHLTASTFYGGPERQMCGLARILPEHYRSAFLAFSEGGRCQPFLDEVRTHGFEATALEYDTPRIHQAVRQVAGHIRRLDGDVLCCHGYKANVVGRLAARRVRIPVVAVSRGWTGASLKVRFYEALDRLNLRWMDRVVCVSEAQADKVRRARVPAEKIVVIHNAIRADRFASADASYRATLQGFFPFPRRQIIGAAGRLSPEKGFDVFVRAAAALAVEDPALGFILFGHGPLQTRLTAQIAASGLEGRCVLAGFRSDLDSFLPHLDVLVLPSYTEGLPNVVLEAGAAGVPVVATAVGGSPEAIVDGVTGYLAPAGSPTALAARIRAILTSEPRRRAMGLQGREHVRRFFSFDAQGERYRSLFDELLASRVTRRTVRGGRLVMEGARAT
jgi:glycosyltransferase involved in cell wall biosynthesis